MTKRVLGVVTALALVAGPAWGQIINGPHDFRDQSGAFDFWPAYASYAVCSTCHTAHHAMDFDAPLWIHTTTEATFTLYSSPTLDMPIAQPGAGSKTCLSCHDGTVAVDALDGDPGDPTTYTVTGDILIGTDLSHTHPVGITYAPNADQGWANLYAQADVESWGLKFYNDKLECGTCHDVHIGGSGPALRDHTDGSPTICMACHNK